MDIALIRVGIVLLIALIYMLFDIFNNRNVPTIFAYATLVVGIVMFATYYPAFQTVEVGGLVAIIVGSIGYVFYRAGQIGAADVIELAVISLILPLQPVPYLVGILQYNIPFIISVFLATGLVALLIIPVYYLPRAERLMKKKLFAMVTRRDMVKGLMLLVAYAAFGIFIAYALQPTQFGLFVLALVALGSVATAVFETPITDSMVEFITVDKFEEGDIIALNLMKGGEIAAAKRRVSGFDRLVTSKIIESMKRKRVTTKFPVYRKAMPLALPIFVGVLISLLIGNLIFFII
jgi:hypothetical protein